MEKIRTARELTLDADRWTSRLFAILPRSPCIQVSLGETVRARCDHRAASAFVSIPQDVDLFSLSESEVRRRFPRYEGPCPDCGEGVIFYASAEHYIAGDW